MRLYVFWDKRKYFFYTLNICIFENLSLRKSNRWFLTFFRSLYFQIFQETHLLFPISAIQVRNYKSILRKNKLILFQIYSLFYFKTTKRNIIFHLCYFKCVRYITSVIKWIRRFLCDMKTIRRNIIGILYWSSQKMYKFNIKAYVFKLSSIKKNN